MSFPDQYRLVTSGFFIITIRKGCSSKVVLYVLLTVRYDSNEKNYPNENKTMVFGNLIVLICSI